VDAHAGELECDEDGGCEAGVGLAAANAAAVEELSVGVVPVCGLPDGLEEVSLPGVSGGIEEDILRNRYLVYGCIILWFVGLCFWILRTAIIAWVWGVGGCWWLGFWVRVVGVGGGAVVVVCSEDVGVLLVCGRVGVEDVAVGQPVGGHGVWCSVPVGGLSSGVRVGLVSFGSGCPFGEELAVGIGVPEVELDGLEVAGVFEYLEVEPADVVEVALCGGGAVGGLGVVVEGSVGGCEDGVVGVWGGGGHGAVTLPVGLVGNGGTNFGGCRVVRGAPGWGVGSYSASTSACNWRRVAMSSWVMSCTQRKDSFWRFWVRTRGGGNGIGAAVRTGITTDTGFRAAKSL
jgi:hypothetical protein